MAQKRIQTGFTIVELLIVIVVIGILAAITVVAFNGVQQRANNARTTSDLNSLKKAIYAGRTNTNKTLFQIISNGNHTSGSCTALGANYDLKTLPKTHACWVNYENALSAIEAASGASLSGLKNGDYRGLPYYIDQNEAETTTASQACVKDLIGTFVNPFPASMGTTYAWVSDRVDLDLFGGAGC